MCKDPGLLGPGSFFFIRICSLTPLIKSPKIYAIEKKYEVFADLEKFIDNNPYLSKRRGKFAERNAAAYPWLTRFDFTVEQDFYVKVGTKNKKNIILLRTDIFNIGNLIHSKWGVASLATGSTNATTSNALNFAGVTDGVPSYRMGY
ncbi:hypothetical protein [Dyadobacter sp. LHD-138]|uniref:hypothetical protein n=1 Tax=Dyadobacter sp. LHD-138 TaxID=3071413 RepID=UPI0027E10B93|nr:hypothetical protein [Dyadobacter sp. LHD-138]MDQ6480788.1 hypothetical protein [Dyadobacter sp. LHD-138]